MQTNCCNVDASDLLETARSSDAKRTGRRWSEEHCKEDAENRWRRPLERGITVYGPTLRDVEMK
jgi:hypothetical protein